MSRHKSKRKQAEIRDSQTKIIEDIAAISLDKYCSKPLHQTIFISELSEKDVNFLKQLVKEGKSLEHVSQVHFITYQDVIELIQRLDKENKGVNLPKLIKESVCEFVAKTIKYLNEDNPIPLKYLAPFIKLKILESMYQNYSDEVIKMKKRKQVNEELAALLKDCAETAEDEKVGKKKKKKGKESKKKDKSAKSKKDKKTKSKNKSLTTVTTVTKRETQKELIIDDYSEIIIEDNEIVYDFNVDNQVMFYALWGFTDAYIIEELIKINVPITAIMEILLEKSPVDLKRTHFLETVHMLFGSIQRPYLENTMLMKFEACETDPIREVLENLVDLIKEINYIKRQHLNYIRNLRIHYFGDAPVCLPAKCLIKYNTILNRFPIDCVNVPLILNSLIEEIIWRENGQIYSDSDLSSSDVSERSEKVLHEIKNHQVHEKNRLKMVMKNYPLVGRDVYDITLKYLYYLPPLQKIKDVCDDLKRTVTREAPTDEFDPNKAMIEQCSDFFHLALINRMTRKSFVPKSHEQYDFNKHFVGYDEAQAYTNELPKNFVEEECENLNRINYAFENYHLKEDLSVSVFLQMIFEAMLQFSEFEIVHCRETDKYLVRFHDNIDDFGLQVKIFSQHLPTPICLRDFCKYVATEEMDWLKEHKLPSHSDLLLHFDEGECEGLRDLHRSGLYESYTSLLGNQYNPVEDLRKQTFSNIVMELVQYPESRNLIQFCEKTGTIYAFYLEPRRLQLMGGTKIFHSYDGVKVIVDNSRFMDEIAFCSINITASQTSLYFHSNDPAIFHFILSDETIILFHKDENTRVVKKKVISRKIYRSDTELAQTTSDLSLVDIDNKRVIGVSRTKLAEFLSNFNNKFGDSVNQIFEIKDHNPFELLEFMGRALEIDSPIFKFSSSRPLRHVKRRSSKVEFPFTGILKRVLFKPRRRRRKYRGYSIQPTAEIIHDDRYNISITLPNGLVIATLPRTGSLIEIKQMYKFSQEKEKSRTFCRSGVVIIKNSDGTTKMLRSNGDIIELWDKGTHDIGCRKEMTKVFEKSQAGVSPFHQSRGDGPVRIKKMEKEIVALYEFGDIPYTKKRILDFNGNQTTVFEDVMTEEQKYYVINEQDYHAEEIYYERDDGFRCVVDKKGTRIIQFPDNTRIHSWYNVEKDPIFVPGFSKGDGWVLVTINYTFEHPNYISVTYNEVNGYTRLNLSNATIKISKESFRAHIGDDIVAEVDSGHISFGKSCFSCLQKCTSVINLNVTKPEETLLEVCDSYNKKFICDSEGNCEINTDYIKGVENKEKCDHYWTMEHQQCYIINQDFSGSLLWQDSLIEGKIVDARTHHEITLLNYYHKLSKTQYVKFFTEIYQSYPERLTMSRLYKQDISLTKYQHPINTVMYVAYRVLYEFQDSRRYKTIIEVLNQFLDTNGGLCPRLAEGVSDFLTYMTNYDYNKIDKASSYHIDLGDVGSGSSRTSSGSSLETAKTVQDVIREWREKCNRIRQLIKDRKFPPYFQSSYYELIKSSAEYYGFFYL